MTQGYIYGIDCGTTNWRIHRLAYAESEGTRQPKGQPQPVALTFFTGAHLPAALLLDEQGKVLHYGNNAYQEARNPDLRQGLRDAFKLCVGNQAPVDEPSPKLRYSHEDALEYTRLLLAKVMERLLEEHQPRLDGTDLFYFSHPVHWGEEAADGSIEGKLLSDFADMVQSCFPAPARERVHFVAEPIAALLHLARSNQVQAERMTLVVDVGGGTTDLVAGMWTAEGLREPRPWGGPCGSGLFDHDLAGFVADALAIPQNLRAALWTELCHYGKELKEGISQQMSMNADQPVSRYIGIPVPNGEPPYFSGYVKMDRATFERRTQATSEQFKSLVLETLVRMDLRISDIQQVVLVGGGANLYLVPRLLKDLFQDKAPVTYASPPEDAIVAGAVWKAIARAESPIKHISFKFMRVYSLGNSEEKFDISDLRFSINLRNLAGIVYPNSLKAKKAIQYLIANPFVSGGLLGLSTGILPLALVAGHIYLSHKISCLYELKDKSKNFILHPLSYNPSSLKSVVSIAFSEDGRWLASGSSSTIDIWQIADKAFIRTLRDDSQERRSRITHIAFSQDGLLLAVGLADGSVELWNIRDGFLVRTLPPIPSPISAEISSIGSVAFSPDGRWFASESRDNDVHLWRVANWTFPALNFNFGKSSTPAKNTLAKCSIVFSPDGQWLASNTLNNSVLLSKVERESVSPARTTLIGHEDVVHGMVFSPDGRWLASGSSDKSIRLWSVANGQLVQTLTGHEGPVLSVAFSSDGQRLASGSSDNTVRYWELDSL